ncbi:hypothetical protein ACXDF8_26125 [Mycolicibacterium sp. CBM1]
MNSGRAPIHQAPGCGRRVETLLCWREKSPADVAYAAAMTGIATSSLMSVVATSSG